MRHPPRESHDDGMFDGFHFFGSRASLVMDLVAFAMAVVTPVMLWSIAAAGKGRWGLHRRVQVALAAALFAAVAVFEVEMRIYGWRDRAAASPYYPTGVNGILAVHLAFAVSAALGWATTTVLALRHFARKPTPGPHSRIHVKLGRATMWATIGTTATGWTFYWAAFVAR